MKLSIVLPVYNKAKYVKDGLKKVSEQTLSDIEIICVDDGSTDGSAEIVSEYAKRDNRVRLILQSNQGSGAARNAGIKAACGEYIAFLDADDYYPCKDTLARLYSVAKLNNAVICGGSFCEVNSDRQTIQFDGVRAGNTFVREGWLNFCDYQFDYGFYRFIYSREFLKENNIFFPNYRRYQDPPFMLRTFAAAGRFYTIPDITYCYRVGATAVKWDVRKVFDLLCGIEDELKFSEEHGYNKIYALNYHRLCNDFCGPIVSTAMRCDSYGEILKKLIFLQSAVNAQILKQSGMFSEREIELSRPLSQLILKLSKQSGQLGQEGWFINKKIFRLYTWPVRAVGKYLQCKKLKIK